MNVILALIIIPLVIFLITWLFQWLWNITVPGIFGLREITFWEAFRLIIMAGILFGGGRWTNIGG
ncbi:succinate dehydrogenase hydrophobic anchor subunit [Anaerosolibacter carboniphilus]|uniref:Succinate dehydrogenase hydrophobic anchor subunit n=1 Tax=Anaerosolibacter carboniphilus TaxID=1417629 RepID=A0A841L6J8_9FIRM|nr:hypothetical protein [Anaerosolibacter carboniphilus]MBB6218009.1 succinate dehydrogenase hydrophobic anchor subunit [Anaerosolibacter carboniphilus]